MQIFVKRKIWIVTGIFALFLVASGCSYVWLSSQYYFVSGSIGADDISQKAIEKKDPSLCSRIVLIGLADVSGEKLVDLCYGKVAQEMRDITICNAIPAVYDRRDFCKLHYSQELNVFTCDDIANQILKGLCYSFFTQQGYDFQSSSSAISQPGNATDSPCEAVGESGRDLCYLGVAENSADISVCEKDIKDVIRKNQCYLAVGSKTNDISVCEKITDANIFQCFTEVAIETNNPSLCERIENDWDKGRCYSGIAFRYKDFTLCQNIAHQGTKDTCLSWDTSSTVSNDVQVIGAGFSSDYDTLTIDLSKAYPRIVLKILLTLNDSVLVGSNITEVHDDTRIVMSGFRQSIDTQKNGGDMVLEVIACPQPKLSGIHTVDTYCGQKFVTHFVVPPL